MTDDARLKSSWADSQRSSLASEHIDVDTLSRLPSGKLSAPIARVVNEHLAVCDDGRCVDFMRSLNADVDATSGARFLEAAPPAQNTRGRMFQARDAMWATFESMAREQGTSTDELVSEAMSAYARVRGYDLGTEPSVPLLEPEGEQESLDQTHEAPAASPLDRSYAPYTPPQNEDDLARTVGQVVLPRSSIGRATSPNDATQSRAMPATPSSLSHPPHRRPVLAGPSSRLPPPQPPSGRPGGARSAPVPIARKPSIPPRLTPPSGLRPTDTPRSTPSSARGKQLVLTYQGQTQPVDKERFLVGRSKTQADLRLDDPNVSRQHAVIERVGSAWYIVDLGSTNGVHVAGERVVRRALSDGDVLVITTHEIHCSLR